MWMYVIALYAAMVAAGWVFQRCAEFNRAIDARRAAASPLVDVP